MSKLDDILKFSEVTHVDAAFMGQHFHGVNTPAVKHEIKDLMLELIGEPKPIDGINRPVASMTPEEREEEGFNLGKNDKVVELRKKVEEL